MMCSAIKQNHNENAKNFPIPTATLKNYLPCQFLTLKTNAYLNSDEFLGGGAFACGISPTCKKKALKSRR
jgi:hypothetical protein